MKFLKQVLRLAFAIPLGLFAISLFKFGSFGNVIIFMVIYIGASLIIEPLFNIWEGKKNKTKKK